MSNTYSHTVTLDKDFLKHSKDKYLKTLPVDMLIQSNNEWLGTIVTLKRSEKTVEKNLNKAHSKVSYRSKQA